MTKFLVEKSLEDVGVSVIKDACKDLVTTASNIIWSAAYTAEFGKENISTSDKDTGEKVVNKNMATLDYSLRAIFNKIAVGESDTVIQTTSTGLACRRTKPKQLGGRPIAINGAQVVFPGSEILLSGVNTSFADVQMLTLPDNPYTWDKTSPQIKSSIVELRIKDDEGRTIKVENLPEDIDIVISDVKEPPSKDPPVYYKKGDNRTMQYHTITHATKGATIRLGIHPTNESDFFAAFIKYGTRPTVDDYDMKWVFPNYTSCVLNNMMKPVNCSEDPYQIYIPSESLTQLGYYFVGVKLEHQPHEDVKDRQRRDCAPGRRVKRSCIKYKDPPSPLPDNGAYKAFVQSFNERTDRNYSMDSMSVGCSYWDESASTWTTEGCKARRRKQSSRLLSCGCSHMTAFGGSFLVAPNPIDLDKVWVGFLTPEDNIPVYVTMAIVFLIYILAVIWGRRADKRDRQSQDGVIIMTRIQSSNVKPYKYQITIYTGNGRGAGTTAKVSVIVVGENGTSDVIPISDLTKAKFNRGSQTRTMVYLPVKLGPLLYIQIWHDNGGSSPAWFLSNVNIRDVQENEEWDFVCDKWLAVETADCRIDALLYVANPKDYNSYKRIYITKTSRDLYDGHLWFSVAAKPPTSHFTRVQRSSCCLSLLFCTMMTNCMFYNITNEPDSTVVIIGPFKVSLRVFVIGIQSSLIVFPINFLLTFLFRKCTESGDPKKLSKKATEKVEPGPFMHLECCKNENKSLRSKCGELFNNRTLYYIAWVLCVLTISTSFTVTMMYTLQWSKETSEKWLISFLTSFFQDALITQPVKVFAIAALLAFIIRERKQSEKKNKYRTLKNAREEDLISIDMSSDASHSGDKGIKYRGRPPNRKILKNARLLRLKEMNTYGVVRDVVGYIVFMVLLMTYAFGHMDPLSFEFTKQVGDLFKPQLKHNSIDAYWKWMADVVVPHLFAGKWYNGQTPGENEQDLIYDRASVLVGMARLRQLRVKEEKHDTINPWSRASYDSYSILNEDKDFYQPKWKPLSPGMTKYNVTLQVCPLHWRYQDQLALDGIPFWGRTELYSGGGYVADLGYFKEKAYPVLTELSSKNWLDRRTRACFLEFVIYNAQKNLFSAATILIEFLPTGSLLPYSRIDTLRVYRYVGKYSDIFKVTEMVIALVMVFLLYKLVKNIYKQRKSFFKFFWNWVDFLQVVFGLVAITLYFVKMVVLNKTMDDLKENPFVFVNFQYTIFLNEVNNYFVAAVVFLTTLKFLCLLKYQSYIKLLEHVFASFAYNMSWFMLEFLLWFMPFVLFAYFIFGPHLYQYSTVVSAFESTLNSLLGAKSFYQLEETDHLMGPILFIGFNLLMVLVLLNIFIAIITSSFNRELDDEFTRQTKPEIMLIFNQQLQRLFGFDLRRNTPPPPLIFDDTDTETSNTEDEEVSKDVLSPKCVHRMKNRMKKKRERIMESINDDIVCKIDRIDSKASKILTMEELENRLYELVMVANKMKRLKIHFRELSNT